MLLRAVWHAMCRLSGPCNTGKFWLLPALWLYSFIAPSSYLVSCPVVPIRLRETETCGPKHFCCNRRTVNGIIIRIIHSNGLTCYLYDRSYQLVSRKVCRCHLGTEFLDSAISTWLRLQPLLGGSFIIPIKKLQIRRFLP